ncbi:hypothetical protein KCU67_g6001, partial [Aureobasidium melanogenum]
MASDSNTDWHSRLNEIVQLFHDENYAMCETELRTVLGCPQLPHYYKIRCLIILAQCMDGWFESKHHRTCAEAIWYQWRMMCPAEKTDDNGNHVMDRLRGMLDKLEEDMVADRPEDWYKLDGVAVYQDEPGEKTRRCRPNLSRVI